MLQIRVSLGGGGMHFKGIASAVALAFGLAISGHADPILVAQPLKAPAAAEYPRGQTVVSLCYTDDPNIKRVCEQFVMKLKACGLKVLQLWDKSPKEIQTALKDANLGPETNVFLSSHGFEKHLRGNAGKVETVTRHSITVPTHLGFDPKIPGQAYSVPGTQGGYIPYPTFFSGLQYCEIPRALKRVNLLYTEDIMDAIDASLATDKERPAKFVSTCHAGGACTGKDKNIGGSCAANEKTYGITDQKGNDGKMDSEMEDQVRVLGHLMCNPGVFAENDKDKNGKLDETELTAYFEKLNLPRKTLGGEAIPPQTLKLEGFKLAATTPMPLAAHALLGVAATSVNSFIEVVDLDARNNNHK